ncbi:hypothetical protein [Actinomadura sp. RB99]|uniref:hypothetical protein n=1 Tax=Actinomadura sp. RB99 TaxID=2691577 RepID=UPI0016883C76|nr:hypothetical protein [Actinomadura sp. RB99]
MLRLNIGPPRSMWIAWLGCLAPMTALLNLALGALCGAFITDGELRIIGVLMLLPLLLLDGLVALMSVQYYRGAFWLDGRVLVRRVLPGHRRYDLSTARITVESAEPAWTSWRGGVLPRLVVQEPGGPSVRMWLRDPARRGALLPPDQLTALAQAIDPRLQHPIATHLHHLAANPF